MALGLICVYWHNTRQESSITKTDSKGSCALLLSPNKVKCLYLEIGHFINNRQIISIYSLEMTKKKDYKLFQGRDLSSGLHITKILWNGRGWNKGRKKESLHPQHQASCQKQGRDFILLWNGRKSNHEITYWKREMKEMEQLLRQANVNYNSAEFLPGPLKVLGHTHTHTLSLSLTHTHTHSHTLIHSSELASWSDCHYRGEAESHTPDHQGQERFVFGNFNS